MATINPYLNFGGRCEEAFNFYKSVFGGEFDGGFMRYGDMPGEYKPAAGEENYVMHVSLPIGGGISLMGSDTPSSMGGVTHGNGFTISVLPANRAEAQKLFNGLAEGGKVTMPLQKTFWSTDFGMLTDKFGIQWLVNYNEPQQ